ncbi:MAG: hypothetical protein PVJ09_04290 [Candidatus Woesebacteria bacterium]|jgi:hypothetical protein
MNETAAAKTKTVEVLTQEAKPSAKPGVGTTLNPGFLSEFFVRTSPTLADRMPGDTTLPKPEAAATSPALRIETPVGAATAQTVESPETTRAATTEEITTTLGAELALAPEQITHTKEEIVKQLKTIVDNPDDYSLEQIGYWLEALKAGGDITQARTEISPDVLRKLQEISQEKFFGRQQQDRMRAALGENVSTIEPDTKTTAIVPIESMNIVTTKQKEGTLELTARDEDGKEKKFGIGEKALIFGLCLLDISMNGIKDSVFFSLAMQKGFDLIQTKTEKIADQAFGQIGVDMARAILGMAGKDQTYMRFAEYMNPADIPNFIKQVSSEQIVKIFENFDMRPDLKIKWLNALGDEGKKMINGQVFANGIFAVHHRALTQTEIQEVILKGVDQSKLNFKAETKQKAAETPLPQTQAVG